MKKHFYLFLLSFLVFTFQASAQNILSESFEGTFPPTGWTLVNAGTGNSWTQNTTSTYAYEGTKSMTYAYNADAAANAWVFTPTLALNNTKAYYISFYVRARSTAYPEALKFTVGNANTVAAQTTTLLDSSNIVNVTFRKWTAFYAPSTTSNYNFGFNCHSLADEFNLYVDSVTILEAPLPPLCTGTPAGGAAVSSTPSVCSSASTSITLSVTGSSTAFGLTYQWQSSPAGTNTWTNILNATNLTYTGTITANTDFRRITTCASASTSANSTPVTVSSTSAALTLLSPTNSNNNVTNVFTLLWNKFTVATSYDVYINSTSPPTFFGNVIDTTLTLSSNVANTPFYWSVIPKSSGGSALGCSSPIYMFTTRSTPVNDSCGAAISLVSGAATTGEITGATASPVGSVTCSATSFTPSNDVWYRIAALSSGTATISVIGNYGSGFNPVIAAYSGTCATPTLLSCSNASTTTTETLSLTGLIAGNSYLIRVFSSGTVSNGGLTITATGPALPVTGVVLSGLRNGSKTQLSWKTLTEINNAGFELQRSADGKYFSSIASIASKATGGSSTAVINYNIDDAKPLGGANYYRLKQTDKDGKISYSNIVYLKGLAVSNLTLNAVYPNPANDVLKAAIQAPAAESITFLVTDMMGKTLSRQIANVISGDNSININVANLPSGNYLLKAICRNGCETAYQKFTKQ